MEPVIDAGTNTIDKAAQFGPEVFLAVVVIILFSAFMYLLITQGNKREERTLLQRQKDDEMNRAVVANNTKALLEVVHMVAKTCGEIEDHEKSTVAARQDVHDNKQFLGRIDTRTEVINERTKDIEKATKDMDGKLDVLVGRVQ